MGSWDYCLLNPKPCLTDWKLCLCAYFLPWHPWGISIEKTLSKGDSIRCITIGQIPIIGILLMPCWRRLIRENKGIDGNICFDCIAVYFCPCCAIFQGSHEAGVDGGEEFEKTFDLLKSSAKMDLKGEITKVKDQGQGMASDMNRA